MIKVLSLRLSLSLSLYLSSLSLILSLSTCNVKIYNIHRLAVPADRRPVWAGDAFTTGKSQLQRGRRLIKRPMAQHSGDRMKCNGDSLYLFRSLSLSLSYACIYVLDCQPKIPTRWFLRVKQVPIINISDVAPHISCGRFPWKTERAWAGGSTHGKIVG